MKEIYYKATLDLSSLIITLAVIGLFITVSYNCLAIMEHCGGQTTTILYNSGIILFLVLTIIISFLLSPKGYIVTTNQLIIRRSIKPIKINLRDIVEVQKLEGKSSVIAFRTFGVGGLFGYFGKYYYPNLGHTTVYATKRSNRIFIKTKTYGNYIITPDDINIYNELFINKTAH